MSHDDDDDDEDEDEDEHQTLLLAPDANAPGLARDYLSRYAAFVSDDVLDDAHVRVTELVTNAIRYGRPEIRLQLNASPPKIGVAIHDAGSARPHLASQPPPPTAEHGRGLLIVDALANAWGVIATEHPTGKTVWFEVGGPYVVH
jgi:anti-sigma regulatory factor (Ser/Thr protein kinase)